MDNTTLKSAKFTDIDLAFIKDYLRVDYDDDDTELNLYLITSKAYMKEYSGKSEEELDCIAYSPIPLIKLVSDMYDNKSATVDNTVKEDMVFKMTMNMLRSYVL